MEIEEWKTKNKGRRNYAHFDNKVSLDDVWDYINNPMSIELHSFYPFIKYIKRFNKFSKNSGIKPKERELCYSSHVDRCIFQYYGYKLNQLYNSRVEKDGISNSAIAYRDNLKKNNINFAKQAIDFIKKFQSCYIIVGDFTKFFDSLEHKYLKNMLNSLLGTKGIPADYYAVYKNITKFSTWDMEDILHLNRLPNSDDGIKRLNELERALTFQQFKKYKKEYVKPHLQNYGIPQGSAISAILSNIYMLEFDKKLNDYISNRSGLYLRYSDDFIIILPKENEDVFKEQFNYISDIINSTPKLDLQPDKTKIFEYKDNSLISCNELVLADVKNGKNLLNYLGFTFDGHVVTIRDKTISKYYYRMYRKIKTIVVNNGYTKYGNRISYKKIYQEYSVKGANSSKGNFITYVKRSENIFGKDEAINRGTKKHMQKIKKKLNALKY